MQTKSNSIGKDRNMGWQMIEDRDFIRCVKFCIFIDLKGVEKSLG